MMGQQEEVKPKEGKPAILLGYHIDAPEDLSVLGCSAVSTGIYLPTATSLSCTISTKFFAHRLAMSAKKL